MLSKRRRLCLRVDRYGGLHHIPLRIPSRGCGLEGAQSGRGIVRLGDGVERGYEPCVHLRGGQCGGRCGRS